MLEIASATALLDLLQVYFQKTRKKAVTHQNRSDERSGEKGGEGRGNFSTSLRLGSADRFLTALSVCFGPFGNRLVATLLHCQLVAILKYFRLLSNHMMTTLFRLSFPLTLSNLREIFRTN